MDESSSPLWSSCGLDVVMEEEGEMTIVLGDDWLAMFLNIWSIESALDTFVRPEEPNRLA